MIRITCTTKGNCTSFNTLHSRNVAFDIFCNLIVCDKIVFLNKREKCAAYMMPHSAENTLWTVQFNYTGCTMTCLPPASWALSLPTVEGWKVE